MHQHDRVVVTGIVGLLALLWLGFLAHRSPDFAGSAWGGVFAVSGAALMLVPAIYSMVKRIAPDSKVTSVVTIEDVEALAKEIA